MQLLIRVCKELKVSPAKVFRCAYDYSDIKLAPELMEIQFESCYLEDKDGKRWMIHSPWFVQDYCIALLAKKVTLPTNQEMMSYK